MIKDGVIPGPLMAAEAETKAAGEKISDEKILEAEKKS